MRLEGGKDGGVARSRLSGLDGNKMEGSGAVLDVAARVEISVPNGPGARQGPEDGLPRARDRTGRQKICRPRPQNLKTAVFSEDDGPAI